MRLVVRDLKKRYGDKTILDGASFSFFHGISYGIVGNKDDGKTTFLKCICGETGIDSGYIRIEADWKEHRTKYSDFGIVADSAVVPEYMTGYEFFDYLIEIHPLCVTESRTADDYFDMVGLNVAKRNNLIKEYSYNEKRKIQVLAVILLKPSVIIFDEPVKNSNKRRINRMKAIIEDLKKDRIVIVATENPDIAEAFCDEFLCFEDGHILSLPAEDVRTVLSGSEETGND